MNTYQVQVGRHGVINLPKQLREQNKFVEGENLTLFVLTDDVLVINRNRSRVDEVADKLAKEWQSSGESLESMLLTLREVRTEHYKDKQ
jgi:bifunctional DNA-binding transcriptional regulator/antitoxin component of YhaV-PrlF toxin-antitoxin module